MIYFDNAASTWPKPQPVIKAMTKILETNTANPGRAAHKLALDAGRIVLQAREKVAEIFNAEGPEQIIFGSNATYGLNLAIKGCLHQGDHVITSSMEHNSVIRPLAMMKKSGVEVSQISCDDRGRLDLEKLKEAIRPNTKLIVLTHASNVTGTIMPVAEVGNLAKQKGIIFLVDAAQTAGVLPIDVQEMQIDMLAFPGHKSLLGPQGTGGLYLGKKTRLNTLLEGGTGGNSESLDQPDILPDRFESGTPNTTGLAGLAAAVEYIQEVGLENIRRHEQQLTKTALEGLKEISGIKIYGPENEKEQVGVISFNLNKADSGEVGYLLDNFFQIAVRAGLHCAPAAHRTLGTLEQGTVRISFSYFNQEEDVEGFLDAVRQINGELE